MFKTIKIFFMAILLVLAMGTKPFAKEKERVHNKAPGIELAKIEAAECQFIEIAPVNVFSAEIISTGTFYNELKTEEKYVTTKKLVGLKPPLFRRSQYFNTYTAIKYDFRRSLVKWKDIHRKHLSIS